jgi:hypothetical protein
VPPAAPLPRAQRIEFQLLAHHAADDVTEKSRFGRQVLLALDLAADPVTFELGQDLVQRGACDVHLVERLYRRKARSAAAIGLPLFGRPGGHGVNRPRRGA